MSSVATAVAEELQQAGVDRAFGLPGGEVLYVLEELRQHGTEFVLCRHEANAGIMAAVYGKLKRRPGVVLTTLGPGAANLMLPLSNSLLDREPLLALSAQIPASWPTAHTHQRLPLVDCYRPVTKFAAALDSLTARRTIRRAIEICLEEPAGPVYLTLSAEESRSASHEPMPPGRAEAATGDRSPAGGDAEAVAGELCQRLARAECPLVLLGLGAPVALAEQLRTWLDEWGLPVAVTPKVKGIVDETADNFVGVVGGMAIDNVLVGALRSADLLIGFGFDPVEVDKRWHAELPIVWVLDEPLALQVVPQQNLLAADYGLLLEALNGAEAPRTWPDPFGEFKRRRNEFWAAAGQAQSLRDAPVAIVRALAEVLPPETIVTTDVGSHKYLFGQFWPSRKPETFFMSNGLSAMGYGLPAAIGAKLARPDAPVLAVLGDGGFSMNSQELETAQRAGAAVIVLVIADRSYSLIHHSQKSKGLPNYGVDFTPIDSVLTARACGVDGVRVETARELAAAVSGAVAWQRSLIVEVPVDVAAYGPLV